jgi:hypothetical protein
MTKGKQQIPSPPDESGSWESQAAYFEKYDLVDMESAGYIEPLSKEDQDEIDSVTKSARARVAARKSRGQLNLGMSTEQLDRFTRYADKKHIPPSTLAKAWILERLDNEAKEA